MDITPVGERLVKIALVGRLDTQGIDQLETRFTSAIVPGSNSAIVDLTQVDFLASMGIRMLISVARLVRTRGARMALYGATAPVGQVLEAVSLHKIIPVCTTEADALAAVTAPRA